MLVRAVVVFGVVRRVAITGIAAFGPVVIVSALSRIGAVAVMAHAFGARFQIGGRNFSWVPG